MAAEKIVTESALSALASDAKNAILDVYPTESVEASEIATFNTDIELPLKNVKCAIVASGGGGTPSTPIAINGYSAVNLVACGKNLYNKTAFPFEMYSVYNPTVCWTKPFYLPANTYAHSCSTGFGTCFINIYGTKSDADANTNRISQTSFADGGNKTETYSSGVWVRIQQNNTGGTQIDYDKVSNSWQIELGSSATAYAPYNGTTDTIALGSTVYGGELDVTSGVLTIAHDYVDLGNYYWSYNSNYGFICTGLSSVIKNASSYSTKANILCDKYETDTYDRITSGQTNYCIGVSAGGYGYVVISNSDYNTEYAFNQAIQGTMLAFEMKTPQTVQLTPTQVQAIVGDNNVFCDTGTTAVVYRESIQKYVNDHGATRTDVVGTLTAGSTSITLSNAAIKTTSTIEVFTDPEVPYNSLTVTNGQAVLTFDAQANNVSVKVRVT